MVVETQQERDGSSSARWLLVSVQSAGAPPSVRVHVWRKLRSLGAVYLQQSVCLLPAREEVEREIKRLLDRVEREGGTGRCLRIALADPDEEAQLRAEFQAARDEEYGEILDRTPAFMQELAMERGRGRVTYAEVEESEADLERFRAWLEKIEKRDYFRAPRGEEARTAIARCGEELHAFEAEALSADTGEPHPIDNR